MNTEQANPVVVSARTQLALAARKIVLRIFEVTPVMGHREWSVLYLARIARDMERANAGLPGPEAGPHSEWYTIPLKYIERSGEPDANVDLDLAEKVIREQHPFPARI